MKGKVNFLNNEEFVTDKKLLTNKNKHVNVFSLNVSCIVTE